MDLIFLGNVSPAMYGVLAGLMLLLYVVFFKKMVLFLDKNLMHFVAAAILTLTYFIGPVFGIVLIIFLKFIVYVVENPRECPKVYNFIDEIF